MLGDVCESQLGRGALVRRLLAVAPREEGDGEEPQDEGDEPETAGEETKAEE